MRSTSLILLLAISVYAVPLVNSHHNEPNRAASPEVSEVRERDWARNALDRAADVRREVAQQREQDATN